MYKILPIILLSSFNLFSLNFDFEFNGFGHDIKKTFEVTKETETFKLLENDLDFLFLINSANLPKDQRSIDVKIYKNTQNNLALILNPKFLTTLENQDELKTDDINMKISLRN